MSNTLLTQTGQISVVIGGKLRTFKFGMLYMKLLETEAPNQKTGAELYGLTFWAGLMARAEINDLPTPFTVDTVLDWIDDLSEEDLAQVLALSERAVERIPNVSARVDGLLGRERDAQGNIIPKVTGTPTRKQLSK